MRKEEKQIKRREKLGWPASFSAPSLHRKFVDELLRDPCGVCDWSVLASEISKQINNQSGYSTDLCAVTSSVRSFRRLSSGLRIEFVNK